LAHAARWNGHAPQTATGAARVSDSHCQLSNCSGATIAITNTGRVSSAEITSRRRRDATSASSSGVSLEGWSGRAGGSGNRAV